MMFRSPYVAGEKKWPTDYDPAEDDCPRCGSELEQDELADDQEPQFGCPSCGLNEHMEWPPSVGPIDGSIGGRF